MAFLNEAKHDDLDLFQEQEAEGSDALNDDTFGDASPIGDDWQPSAAQEAFHRELQQARNRPSLSRDAGPGIGPPPGLANKPRQERGPGPSVGGFEALRSLGLENPPSLLGQPPPAGLFDGLSSLPASRRPDLGHFPQPHGPPAAMLAGKGSGKGWPPSPFLRPDALAGYNPFPRAPRPAAPPRREGVPPTASRIQEALAKQAALAALRASRTAAPPVRPRQTIMSVQELEAQMMADQMPPPSPLGTAHMSRGLISSTMPPGLGLRPPGPPSPPKPPGPPGPPRDGAPIPSFLDSLLLDSEPASMPPSPQPVPAETRKWISPFTDKHREAVLEGAESSKILEPFLKSENLGRQHVGLMTSSDKELIVRIQLGQLASIGEMEPRGHEVKAQPEHPEHLADEMNDRSFGALRASVHHSRASVDVAARQKEERDAVDALPAGLLEAFGLEAEL